MSRNNFDDYNHNYEFATTNMTMITSRGNYDYKYDYTTNVDHTLLEILGFATVVCNLNSIACDTCNCKFV